MGSQGTHQRSTLEKRPKHESDIIYIKKKSAFLTHALFALRSPVLLTAASIHMLLRQQGGQGQSA